MATRRVAAKKTTAARKPAFKLVEEQHTKKYQIPSIRDCNGTPLSATVHLKNNRVVEIQIGNGYGNRATIKSKADLETVIADLTKLKNALP